MDRRAGSGPLETSEAIEIGDCISRPFKLHRLCQGRNEGVPQLRNQPTTCSCGIVSVPAAMAVQRRSSSAISSRSTAKGSTSRSRNSRTSSDTVIPRAAARLPSDAAALSSSLCFAWSARNQPSRADQPCRDAGHPHVQGSGVRCEIIGQSRVFSSASTNSSSLFALR